MGPSFYCVGAPKTATTSLYRVLVDSGLVFPTKLKEPHYLNYQGHREFILGENQGLGVMDRWVANEEQYLEMFKVEKNGPLKADFSTHYLKDIKKFKKNGLALFGEAFLKTPIIVVLRHPVDRAFSHYAMKIRDGVETLSFSEAIQPEVIEKRMNSGYLPTFDYIGFSRYADSINFLKEHFENILILDQLEIKKDFDGILKKLSQFLKLDIKPVESVPVLNKSGQPKKEGLSGLIYSLVFQDNWVKRLLPDGIKNKMASSIKQKTFSLVMDKLQITDDEYKMASNILQDEIMFYKKISQYNIQ